MINKVLIARTLIFLYFIFILFALFYNKNTGQIQFKENYYFARAYNSGIQPYDIHSGVMHKPLKLDIPYKYPPITNYIFILFSKLSYDAAYNYYLILKIIAFILLIVIWKKIIDDGLDNLKQMIFVLFAFSGAVYMDVYAGNIMIFEQLLIWFSFYNYLNKKYVLFCVFIVLCSFFTVMPVFFVFLLLFSDFKKKFLYLILTIVSFLLLFFIQYLIDPALFKYFVSSIKSYAVIIRYTSYPTTFSFIYDLIDCCRKMAGINNHLNVVKVCALIGHLLVSAFVIVTSYIALQRLTKTIDKEKHKIVIFLFCSVYTIINIPFQYQDIILLILPAYYLFSRKIIIKTKILLIIFICYSSQYSILPGFRHLFSAVWEYYPLIINYLVWFLYVHEIIELKPVENKNG